MTCAHLQVAVIITLVGLMESIAVAKALAERNGYDLDANQELAGALLLCAASVHWAVWGEATLLHCRLHWLGGTSTPSDGMQSCLSALVCLAAQVRPEKHLQPAELQQVPICTHSALSMAHMRAKDFAVDKACTPPCNEPLQSSAILHMREKALAIHQFSHRPCLFPLQGWAWLTWRAQPSVPTPLSGPSRAQLSLTTLAQPQVGRALRTPIDSALPCMAAQLAQDPSPDSCGSPDSCRCRSFPTFLWVQILCRAPDDS